MSDDSTPFGKDGWKGYIFPHRGTPIGMFIIRVRKGARVITTTPMSPEQIDTFSPDDYWKQR